MKKQDLLQLSAQLKKHYVASFRDLSVETGLNQTQIDVLLFLKNNPSYNTAKNICELRCIVKSQVSDALKRLIADGFVKDCVDDDDKRNRRLFLLEKSSYAVNAALKIQDAFAAKILSGFSTEEQIQLDKLSKKLFNNINGALYGLD